MTTRYRVEYALKTHRRDQLIEWIKGLLAVPFVLHSQPTAAYDGSHIDVLQTMAVTANIRYAEIFRDVETLINDHSKRRLRSRRLEAKLICHSRSRETKKSLWSLQAPAPRPQRRPLLHAPRAREGL